MKSRINAAIFAFCLGAFGAHRFYLGQTGKGFLYLLFCWTLIPSIVAFVEFIKFMTMTDEAFNAKYNHAAGTVAGSFNVSEELEKLHGLKEKGILSESEFTTRKAQLLR